MSHYVVFNLDELSSMKFQELCNALLLKYFSELIHCMVRPGKDGKRDGFLYGLPINYSDMINQPFRNKCPEGNNVLWFFQVKHTQIGDDAQRQKAVLTAFKKEIEDFKKKDIQDRPTHYILLTNVNLKAATFDEIISIGRAFFVHFDIWHEPKISCFIIGDLAMQKAFYPHRSTSLDFVSKHTLKEVMSEFLSNVDNANTTNLKGNFNDLKREIAALVDYEIRFQKANEVLFKEFNISESPKSPVEWNQFKYTAKGKGLLVLSDNSQDFLRFTNIVARNEAQIISWHRHLGEEVLEGDEIFEIACDPEVEHQVISYLDSIFKIVSIDNQAYSKVDQYLRDLEAKIIHDIKNSKFQDVQDGLRQMCLYRQTYSLLKSECSTAFYPSARTFGGKVVVGWDFINLWESVFRNIYDIAFADRIPESLSDMLLSIPFILCGESIRKKRSKDSYRIDLETLKIPFWMIIKKNDIFLLNSFLDKLENLAQEVADIDVQIESSDQADWAFSISEEMVKWIANLGWLSLSQKVPQLPFDQLKKLLNLATSLSFNNLLSCNNLMKDAFTKQKELQKEITLLRNEYIFAWATYEFSRVLIDGLSDPILAIDLLKTLKMSDIVLFYSRNKFNKGAWINEWFIPDGKRVSWSWALDHDIRESLQLAIINLPIESHDFIKLIELAEPEWYKQFLQEIQEMHSKLKSQGNGLLNIMDVLEKAHNFHKENLKTLIKNQKISLKITDEIKADFQIKMLSHSKEGILYTIRNINTKPSLEPSHYVGPHLIDDKKYYIDQIGSVCYLNSSIGNSCAEMLNSQREMLFMECVKKSAICSSYSSDQLEEKLDQICNSYQNDYVLLVSPELFTDIYDSNFFKKRSDVDHKCIAGKIGNVDVIFLSLLEYGEILLVPRLGCTWYVEKKITELDIQLINKDSQLIKQLQESNPNLELADKVLLNGREKGVMVSDESSPFKYFKQQL